MRKALLFLVWGISVILVINLARSVYDLSKREKIIYEAKQELKRVRKKNQEIQEKLRYATSSAYIEKQARDKLNLARPGETVVVLPEITPLVEQPNTKESPVWKRWLLLFKFSM